jgi:molecular chaperone DnaK
MSGRAVGIDLGTSNSVVAVVIDGEAIVISDKDRRAIQPSVVSWLPDGRTVVGQAAKNRMGVDPSNTVYSVKRLVGRPHYAQEVKVASEKYAYNIVKGDDDNPRVKVQSKDYTVEEIQAVILRHMKWIAEQYLGEPVTHAVITVPANFNESQRRATKTAGQLAGLEVLRILNEPTAAALAYGYEQQLRERIAVYDLGGGTFDITVLELRDNVLEVLSTAGDTFLGGDDFDSRVTQMLAEEFEKQTGFALSSDIQAMQRLKSISEKLKIDLSDSETATTIIKHTIPGQSSPTSATVTLTRAAFNRACMQLVQKSFIVCDEALKLAEVTSAEIDRLVLVGGATRMPMVRDMVEQYFFKKPLNDINPDEVVAVGAAIYAYGLELQAAPQPSLPPQPPQRVPAASSPQVAIFGTEPPASMPPVPSGPTGPTAKGMPSASATQVMSPAGPPPPPSSATMKAGAVPPPTPLARIALQPPPVASGQTLAIGIARSESSPASAAPPLLQKSAAPPSPSGAPAVNDGPASSKVPGLSSNSMDAISQLASAPQPPRAAPLLIDVIPQGLGIETLGGYMDTIIPRNSRLPVRQTRAFGTAADFQETVRVNILEGSSRVAEENRPLGELVLTGIPPMQRGKVKIDVSFEINTDGMLAVTARDRDSGKLARTRLNVAGGMSDEAVASLQSRDLPEAYRGPEN